MQLLSQLDVAGLIPFIAVGFGAQLVDGALGMAFGVICNTLLVAVMGVAPARASANVHIVETFTTAVSGISHALHGNIDRGLFLRLLIPGVIGGVTGAYLLTNLDGNTVKPFVLGYLIAVGVYLLIRGLVFPPKVSKPKVVEPLGLIGGFMDAAGGGGWGPIVTSNLLVQGVEPRKVVGTVSAVEFFLTAVVSATFIYHLGVKDFATATTGLLIGGVFAAPLGALFAKRIPMKVMLVLVGTVLTITSTYGFVRAVLM
ncbi:sulfite exporter TauE/SafE family protein [Sphingomonas yunnanensis]|uniref:sulfite exporter TauE/SafE family protein n=1 Tax=Sphingomonas yunnanensis TaxID=310400 RepID=UPI001CA6DD96|nr:sulfite exporter TauE/SafE family protein [Sphingomonas yunnanensis]MBY9061756.1 sulfite exporter TauE/SafE family protein [Sphingomonas yunnanensis]